MPPRNLEIVRGIYEALARGEQPASIHEDAEYVNPDYAVDPGTRPWSAAIERLLEIYPDFRLDPDEFIEAGDQVVVIAHAHGRGVSGVGEARGVLGHVWTLRDGRAVRFRWFKTRAEALEAAGLDG